MRRIALLLTAVVVFALVQGCGTTNRNKAVVNKPGQAGSTDSSAGGAPGFYVKSGTTPSAATPAPVKKEVVKAEPKPTKVEKPAPAPTPAPAKVEKPAPAPKPEVVKAAKTEAVPEIAVSPYSSKGGSAAKPGTVSVNLSKGTTSTPPVQKAPPPPKKEKPAPAPKEVKKPAPKPEPVKKEVATAKPKPAPKPEPAKTEVAKAEPKPAPVKKAPAMPASAPKKEVAKVEPAKKSAPAKAASVQAGAKLGAVSQVNNEYKFIVIEFDDENKKLTAGSIIQIVRGGKVVAKAKLEEPLDHWPLATATVIEGTPEKQDSVAQ